VDLTQSIDTEKKKRETHENIIRHEEERDNAYLDYSPTSFELTFFCTFAEASLRACKAPHGVVDTPESKDEFGRGRPPQQPLAAYRAND